MVHKKGFVGPIQNDHPATTPISDAQKKCEARGGTWENGVCFEADKKEPRKKGALSPRDPGREELRQKQLREDPLFAEKLRIVEERQQLQVEAQAQEELKTPEQKAREEERQAILDKPIDIVELSPPELGATTLPLVGGFLRTIALQGFESATDKDDATLDPIRKNLGIMTSKEISALSISEIQKKELEKGLSASENLGAVIESIPGAKWLDKWLDIETPRGNLEEVILNIKAMKRPILKYGSDVRSGYMDKATATLKLDTAEQYVLSQEARLRQLILNSPTLEFNSDRVNGFEVDILIVKEAIQQARIDTVDGQIRDPTELEVFQQTQFQNTDEWATSDW